MPSRARSSASTRRPVNGSLWRELSPLDPAGVSAVDKVAISADGSAHMYSNKRIISRLVLTEGLGR